MHQCGYMIIYLNRSLLMEIKVAADLYNYVIKISVCLPLGLEEAKSEDGKLQQ